MTIAPNTISSANKSRKKSKRVGRGNASGKGTYSGRGLKGQRSRSGGKSGTKARGLKASIQKVPKIRGFKSLKAKKETVTLATIDRIASAGDVISPNYLKAKSVINHPKNGVKIVASGELKKKVEFKGCIASKNAVELIEKSGSTIKF